MDFNVPLDEQFNITDDTHSCCNAYSEKNYQRWWKVIIGTHLGRQKEVTAKFSLKHILPHISELLGVEVQFANNCIGDEAEAKAAALQPGEVLLLENLRFAAEEEGKHNIADNASDEEKAAAKKAVKRISKGFYRKIGYFGRCI